MAKSNLGRIRRGNETLRGLTSFVEDGCTKRAVIARLRDNKRQNFLLANQRDKGSVKHQSWSEHKKPRPSGRRQRHKPSAGPRRLRRGFPPYSNRGACIKTHSPSSDVHPLKTGRSCSKMSVTSCHLHGRTWKLWQLLVNTQERAH